jgi:hypothetical protein
MIKNRLEDLWESAADDGASTPLAPLAMPTDAEIDELLDAWFLERHKSIEFEMLLKQSRKVIAWLLAEGVDEPENRRKARRFLREIDRCFDSANQEK